MTVTQDTNPTRYGLHDWRDQYGNHGTESISEHVQTLRAIRKDGLFEASHGRPGINLHDYFNPPGSDKRRVFVVLDDSLPDARKQQIEHYFAWCNEEKLLERYAIKTISVDKSDKTLDKVTDVVLGGKHFGMRRRDLFLAIGNTLVVDVVGFAAATYRRAAPFIAIPTDEVGIINAHTSNKHIHVDHTKPDGGVYRGLLAFSHPPTASFYDLSFLDSSPEAQKQRGLAEIVKTAVLKDAALFSYLETGLDQILTGTLATAVTWSADVFSKGSTNFGDELVRAVELITGMAYEDANCVSLGTALLSAVSVCKGKLSDAEFRRILNLLQRANLPISDDRLTTAALAEYLKDAITQLGVESTLTVPILMGKEGSLSLTDISVEDITAALDALRQHSPKPVASAPTFDLTKATDCAVGPVHEWTVVGETQYHVASAKNVFEQSNETIIQNYCVDNTTSRKPKVLVVVDDYPGNSVDAIREYFHSHSYALDETRILSMHVDSNQKTVESMNRVIDAAVEMRMSARDLFLVVGGGTIMDIVGFAASMYKGGIRWMKVPTTLLGMIDAGIAVKVGVNLGHHKNFIGRYYAPLACLNDPETFLATLSKREFACGLAEAIKMAILKSPRLFDLIAKHHRELEYNQYTDEVVDISVYTMLEELQPNLHEHNLRRFVDFGHEFGHIVEGLAKHEIPHGECVAVGMALSSFLALKKGLLSWADLDKILYTTLDLGLPLYLTEFDCCNPEVLWDKIRVDGIEHKNGMLYLVVPEKVGQATFIDQIPEIDAAMVRESVLGLRRYSDWYTGKGLLSGRNSPRSSGASSPVMTGTSSPVNGKPFAASGIRLPLDATKTRSGLEEALAKLDVALQQTLAQNGTKDDAAVIALPGNEWTISIAEFNSMDRLSKDELSAVQDVLSHYTAFKAIIKGVFIRGDGTILAQFDAGEYPVEALRADLSKALDVSFEPSSPWINLGRIVLPAPLAASTGQLIEEMIERDFLNADLGQLEASRALGPDGQEFDFESEAPHAPKLEVAVAPEDQKVLSSQTIHHKPHVLTVDVGATYLRIAVLSPTGLLVREPVRVFAPSKQSFPNDSLSRLQGRLLQTLANEINKVRASYDEWLGEVGISFGAVINNYGIVEDASVLWGEPARGFDFTTAIAGRLPGVRLTVLNDISAAAWRYKDEGRFCLITVSSGLSNKVFNPDLCTHDKLDLDVAGVGGEMGHVVVEPRAVDALVQHAIEQAIAQPESFTASQLYIHNRCDARRITAKHLRMAVQQRDEFALRLLEEANVPCCPCGNFADLCSYSSGRGALRQAKRLAARGGYDVKSDDITDAWLQTSIVEGHPLARKALYDSTYPLALRILQLATDIGLDKFVIVGGFAMKTGRGPYLEVLQDHLVRFCHTSAYYAGWTEMQIRGLAKFGVNDDNDGLIGIGNFVQHLRSQYRAVEKSIGEPVQTVVTRTIPRCGAKEVLAKVVFSGICTTDLEILRGDRHFEPCVIGHEGVCEVVEVGKGIKGLSKGAVIVINPNNPLDDYDKLGHTREGLNQQYVKFGQESLDRNQILILEDSSSADPTDTLIEPLSTVVAAQERMKDRLAGKNVLVIGAGVMGLMFALMSTKGGARNVFMGNRSKEKLDFVIEKGIVPREKTFAIGKSISEDVERVSAGGGVDMVFVCTPMGQGIVAAHEAVKYVNPNGCVYMFSGFRPGDVLHLEGGVEVDITAIRSGWKIENFQVGCKSFDVAGSRGSRNDDLIKASKLIRGDRLFYGKVISHIISLDALPEIMSTLARDRKVRGTPAKRVVVDMHASEGLIERAEALPLRHLFEATRRQKVAISKGNVFGDIGFDGNDSMLGWVCPPAWDDVRSWLDTALSMKSLSSKRDFIFCGTGPWVFLVDSLKNITQANPNVAVHTLQSLDPQALLDLLSEIGDISTTACIGISQSGTTLETMALMTTLRDHFDSAGLDYRSHFAWLTDASKSSHDSRSGEATIRASKGHDWGRGDILSLTIGNHADINALFCAPHSTVTFLALVLLRAKEIESVRHDYQQYLTMRESIVQSILPRAASVAANEAQYLQMDLDESMIVPSMVRMVTQIVAQGLGSKQDGFNPRVRVASTSAGGGRSTGFEVVALPMPDGTPAAVSYMLTMNALAVFVAMIGHHRRINFVTHPKVNRYKNRAKELMAAPEIMQSPLSGAASISARTIGFLESNPQIHFVDMICYGHISASGCQGVQDWLRSCLPSKFFKTSIDVVKGEEWNHSAYQAAVDTNDTLYVVLVLEEFGGQVEGTSTIPGNVKMLQAIARATYETLSAKALYFAVDKDFFRRSPSSTSSNSK